MAHLNNKRDTLSVMAREREVFIYIRESILACNKMAQSNSGYYILVELHKHVLLPECKLFNLIFK